MSREMQGKLMGSGEGVAVGQGLGCEGGVPCIPGLVGAVRCLYVEGEDAEVGARKTMKN